LVTTKEENKKEAARKMLSKRSGANRRRNIRIIRPIRFIRVLELRCPARLLHSTEIPYHL